MGVGNYTEDDIKAAAYSFTGWTFEQPIRSIRTADTRRAFVYRDDLHDHSEKEFLGHTGNFNGEDIIDIIVQQPATGRFIGRHLYTSSSRRAGVSAWVGDRPGQSRCGGRTGLRVRGVGRRSARGDARAVQRRMVQGGPLRARQVPGRVGRGRVQTVGQARRPAAGEVEPAHDDGRDGSGA